MSSTHHLSESHAALIRASVIRDDVRDARGYATVEDAYVLHNRGFAARQALVPALLIPIHPVQGDVLTYQIRPDNPRVMKGEKVRYETPARQPNRIDAHPFIKKHLGDPSVPLFITEGVRKADALVSKDECCIALLGVWNWKGKNAAGGKTVLPDFDDIAWNDRTVYIVFDSDARTKADVQNATVRLKDYLTNRDAKVHVLRLPPAADGGKVGLDDYLAAGHSVDDLLKLVETEQQAQASAKPPAQRTEIMRLGEKYYRFGRSLSNEAFAVRKDGPNVSRSLRYGGGSLRAELAKLYAREHGSAPSQQALTDAFNVFDGLCLEQPAEELALRVARHGDSLIIDRGDATGSAIEVTRDGWRVVARSPVLFRRTELTGVMPEPLPGGRFDDLRHFLNVDDPSWDVAQAFSVAAVQPGFSHPIPLIRGQQGSAKSTSARLFVELIDPSPAPLRAAPRSLDDWAITASASWAIALDNLSHIEPWFADALCRASTGDGWPKRSLYTDGGVSVYSFQRVVILNAIDVGALRPDLADRLITIDLEPISNDRRKEEKTLLADFYAARPGILGGLLDLVVKTLAAYDTVHPKNLPRMADFGRMAAALDDATGSKSFSTYMAMTVTIAIDVIEDDEVVQALKSWMTDLTTYSETAMGWLHNLTPPGERPSQSWPKTPEGMRSRLKRLAPSLKLIGLEVEFGQREAHTGRRMITVRRHDVGDSSLADGFQLSPEGATVTQTDAQNKIGGDGSDSGDGSNAFLSTHEGKNEKRGKNGKRGHEIEKGGPRLSRLSPDVKAFPPIDPEGLRKIVGWAAAKSETP